MGLAVGATTGLVAGGVTDLNNARVGDDFIEDVTKALTPNKVAVVAEIEEDWTTPVDTRMEAIGGTVFRRALSEVKHTIHEENVAAMKADMAQMKAEQAKAHADRKAKLQEKINQLDSKIQDQLQKAKERREASERQVQVLKAKAAAARRQSVRRKRCAAEAGRRRKHKRLRLRHAGEARGWDGERKQRG